MIQTNVQNLTSLLHRTAVTKGGCLVWRQHRDEHGYAKVSNQGKMRSGHRVSWEMAHGPIPDGMVVRHKCDNPPCVNPLHLELGTMLDNVRDCVERGRIATGHRHGAHTHPEKFPGRGGHNFSHYLAHGAEQ